MSDELIIQAANDHLNQCDVADFLKLYETTENLDQQKQLLAKLYTNDRDLLTRIERTSSGCQFALEAQFYEAVGTGLKTTFRNGKFVEEESKHSMFWVQNTKDEFRFVIEPLHNGFGNLTVAEINPALRNKGLFPRLHREIRRFAFNELGLDGVVGRAAPPVSTLYNPDNDGVSLSVEETQDWRNKRRDLRSRKIKLTERPTKLMDLWFKSYCSYPAYAINDEADNEEFVILNPHFLARLPKRQLREIELSYPKPKKYRLNKYCDKFKR